MPATFSVDLGAHYSFKFKNGMGLRLGLQAYNIFDRLNDNWVDNQTGRAYTSIIEATDISSHYSNFNDYEDTIHDPSAYDSPRSVKITLDVNI